MEFGIRRSLLDGIESPRDLKRFNHKLLAKLADEIRAFLIESVTKTGGHLGANLGSVELTLALHKVFDAPKDKFVWDVGHQAYTHKLLTGRKNRFGTLRQHGGISGFLKRNESPYDVFGAGHASTSISAAYGIARARDVKKEKFKVVVVIGDGSMTGGMAYEAMNNAGDDRTRDFIIVLNDNEMSIAKNVGAISRYFNKIITAPVYNRVKQDIDELISKIPRIFGIGLGNVYKRLQEGLKNLVIPDILFEELGFRYFGPIDGHNLKELIETFENIKQLSEPVIVHVITVKGKGYNKAEEDPESMHGISAQQLTSGTPKAPSYTKVFSDTMVTLAEEDDRIVAITAAMPTGTGLSEFQKRFPDRFFDVGIAEQHAVTFAAGLATEGLKPVCAIYSTFLQRAFDQILHDVSIQNLDVTFCLDRGGLVGDDGETHQGTFDMSYVRLIPNLIFMAPKDENELRNMILTAINYHGPAFVRYPRGVGLGVKFDDVIKPIDIGVSEKIASGNQVAICAIGSMVSIAMDARNILLDKGISSACYNMRFIKPIDDALMIDIARKFDLVVTLEENTLVGGFGSAVLETLEHHGLLLETRVLRIGLPDKFIEHGTRNILLEKYGLSPESVADNILKNVYQTAKKAAR